MTPPSRTDPKAKGGGMSPYGTGRVVTSIVATSVLWAATGSPALASPGDAPVSDQQRQVIVEAFAAAFLHDDHDGIVANTTPDATWTVPGSSKVSGRFRGRGQIIALADALAAYQLRITLEAITFGVDTVAVELHDSGENDGKLLDQNVVNVLTIETGKIATVAEHVADVASFDEYFS